MTGTQWRTCRYFTPPNKLKHNQVLKPTSVHSISFLFKAMDRAHRIGQKKVVNVYRLITRGTLEEKIMGYVCWLGICWWHFSSSCTDLSTAPLASRILRVSRVRACFARSFVSSEIADISSGYDTQTRDHFPLYWHISLVCLSSLTVPLSPKTFFTKKTFATAVITMAKTFLTLDFSFAYCTFSGPWTTIQENGSSSLCDVISVFHLRAKQAQTGRDSSLFLQNTWFVYCFWM